MKKVLSILLCAMVAQLTAGLACAFALGFGAPIPEGLVIVLICGGTAAMATVFAVLISLPLRTSEGKH